MVQKMKELQLEEERQNEVLISLIQKKRQMVKKMNDEIVQTNKNAILLIEQRKAKQIEEQ